MSEEASFGGPADASQTTIPSIRVDDEQAVQTWARKLDATAEQIREAVQAVGGQPADVEAHLKGTRSTTNAEQTRAANGR